MIFGVCEKKNTLQYMATPWPAHCNKKTHHQKKSGDVWKPCIRNPAATAVFLHKSLVPYKTLSSGMQFDREIVEHEPGLGGVGEGG